MISGRNMQVPQAESFSLLRATVPSLSNSQIRTSAMADYDAVSTKRNALFVHAMAPWFSVPADNPIILGNNFHKNGRLAQLRDRLSPEPSDHQVRDIFNKRHSGA